MIKLIIIFLAGFAGGCLGEEETINFPLLVRVDDGADQPVADVLVNIDGKAVGATDQRGLFFFAVQGPAARKMRVAVSCPAGYQVVGEANRAIHVTALRPVEAGSARSAPMSAMFSCQPETRTQILLVRTDFDGELPVQVLGETVATTDPSGVAQFVVVGYPGEELKITLDTSEHPELRPAMPSRRFRVPPVSQILVFDQLFQKKKAKRSRRSRRSSLPRRL